MYNLENGTQWTDELKEAFKTGTTYASVILDGQDYNESNFLKEAELTDIRTVPNGGFIGQAVSRMLKIQMVNDESSNLNFENTDIVFKIGAKYNNFVNYINYGNFIVTEPPENDDTNGTVSFIAYDYMIKFNQPFVNSIVYPCTMKDLLLEICSQAGVNLATEHFANENFIVENNQFEGKQLRDVLRHIAKSAFSWARIGQDNRLYLDFEVDDTIVETITPDDYKLDAFKKANEFYGPVNKVTFADSDIQGQEESVQDDESIALNGVHELIIYDNYFAYTTEKRAALIQAGIRLFGLTYMPIQELEMKGLVYLNCQDVIGIEDSNENVFLTRNLSHIIKYNGMVSDILETEAESETEQLYSNVNNNVMQNSRTEIIVDRSKREISNIVEDVDGQNTTIAKLDIRVGELESQISDISDITTYGESDSGVVELDDVNESEPIMIRVHPTTTNISYTYPYNGLYPDNTLYLQNRIINFKRTYVEDEQTLIENIPYEIPEDLLRYDNETYDEFYLDYDTQTCQVTKRCEYFGGSGTNIFNPSYMAGSRSYITSMSLSPDEIFTVIPSATFCAISLSKQFVLTSNFVVSFANLRNISINDIQTTVTYYNPNSQVVTTETTTGVVSISSGVNRAYFMLSFRFNNTTAGTSFDFSVMMNTGTNPATYETYNPVVKKLAQEEIHNYAPSPEDYPTIALGTGDYEVSLPGYNSAYLFVRLMASNIYTTQFATKAEMNSAIQQSATDISISVGQTLSNYSTTTQMNTAITLKADDITSKVARTYEEKENAREQYTQISQTFEDITLEVGKKYNTSDFTNAKITAKINDGSSSVKISADKIELSANGVINVLSGNTINLTSKNIAISSNNFSVSTNGTITATAGTIGGWTIGSNRLYSGSGSSYVRLDSNPNVNSAIWCGNEDASLAPFRVSKTGNLTATNANISGTITATNGTFRNCTITDSCTVPASTVNGALATNNIPTISANKLSGGTINSSTISLKNTTLGTNSSTIGSFTANTSNLESQTANGNIGIGLNLYGNTPAFYVESANGDDWSVITSGGGYSTGRWQSGSLKKYKKDFEKLENGLDIINSIDIYKYRLKNEKQDKKKRIGLIIDKDYKYSKEITNDKDDGVDLYSFVSVCCKAIQEQQEQIEQIKQEIETLKGGNK